MKNLSIITAAAGLLLGLASMSSQAATATGTFNVTINLTSACTVNTAATAATFNYTSLQAAAATFATTFDVQCTNTLPIVSVALDSLAVTDNATNLAYTLALAGAPTVANGAAQAVTVNGTMAAGQAGTCATATCTNAAATNKTRTVTITY
jgi:uncharacterized protein YhbP (UPF0306 family)